MTEPSGPAGDARTTPAVQDPAHHPRLVRQRLSDGQALGLLGAWFVFRAVTQRIGLGLGPKLLDNMPWAIPLLNNSFLLLIQAGTGVSGRPGMGILTGLTSVLMSTVVGLVLYWAGFRFGHRLAEMAQRPGSPWAGVWNPKQIARAERWMDRWGLPVIIVVRITEFFYLPVALVAGASEMRLRRFIIANTVGAIGFAGVWLWIGGVAQRRWPWLKDWISDVYGPWALRIGLALLALVVLLMVVGQRFDKSKSKESEGPADEAGASADVDATVPTDDQDRSTITPSQGSSTSPPENDDPSRSRPVDS
jgi:membrane protein DedA with SNARE-associated domain